MQHFIVLRSGIRNPGITAADNEQKHSTLSNGRKVACAERHPEKAARKVALQTGLGRE